MFQFSEYHFLLAGRRLTPGQESFLLPYDLRYLYGLWGHYMNPRVVNTYVYDHYLVWKYVYVGTIVPMVMSTLS